MSDSQMITIAVLGSLSPLWFACFLAWVFNPNLSSGNTDAAE